MLLAKPVFFPIRIKVCYLACFNLRFFRLLGRMERTFGCLARDEIFELGLVDGLPHLFPEHMRSKDFAGGTIYDDISMRGNLIIFKHSQDSNRAGGNLATLFPVAPLEVAGA